MKKLILLVLPVVFIFSGCFNPLGHGNKDGNLITVHLGGSGNSRASCFLTDEGLGIEDFLKYDVTFTNTATGSVIQAKITTNGNATRASATLTPGKWKIRAEGRIKSATSAPLPIYAQDDCYSVAVKTENLRSSKTIPLKMLRPVVVEFKDIPAVSNTTFYTQIVPEGDTIERPKNPEKALYNFVDWYKDITLSIKYDDFGFSSL